MPTCISCKKHTPLKADFHEFTAKAFLRPLWLEALAKDNTEKASLDVLLRTSISKQYVCNDHFSPDSYIVTPTTRVLKKDAVPMSLRPSSMEIPTVPSSPPSTPHSSLLPRLPARPPPSFRLFDASIPPCCRCCCNKQTAAQIKKEIKQDPDWTLPLPIIKNEPSSEYVIVSKASLMELLSRCNSCPSGQSNLTFVEEGHALQCTCQCTSCGDTYKWSNSPVLKTAKNSPMEKLRKVNVDMMAGSTMTAVGTARLNYFLKTVGLNTVSKSSYHQLKQQYLLPAVTEVFTTAQEEIFIRLKARLSKGETLDVAGDGSFDTRGYSAEWCRYFLLDAKTGEALIHVLMNKKETGSSGTLEVACLEKALKALSDKIGGVKHISTLVTDRHSAVIKMMKEQFPSIRHFFDPWHYFRNLTMSLLKITKPAYMTTVKYWTRSLINKAYDAVVKAQGDGVVASEMFRSSLLCICGIHDFSNDSSFTKFKKCLHSPPPANYPFIQKDSRAYKRLASILFTEKNIEDIKNVSWLLKTSTCESLNALAWRYAPKENYFDRAGHELRTMMTMLHWNELKKDEMDGTRVITGQKTCVNHTLKKKVVRNVKTTAQNAWRDAVKAKAYEIRASLSSTPYALIKQEQKEKEKKREEWNRVNTPVVPLLGDTNLDESEDEDVLPLHYDASRCDAVLDDIRRLLEEDDDLIAQLRTH